MKYFILILIFSTLLLQFSCSSSNSDSPPPGPATTLSLTMARLPQAGLDPFRVDVTLKIDDVATFGQTLTLVVPKGTVSAVTDNLNGMYSFTVTPATTGAYPVQVSANGVSLSRQAVVPDTQATGVSQYSDERGLRQHLYAQRLLGGRSHISGSQQQFSSRSNICGW